MPQKKKHMNRKKHDKNHVRFNIEIS